MKKIFAENRIFQYNRRKKIAFGILVIFAVLFITSLALFYFGVLRHSDFFIIKLFNKVASSISQNVGGSTVLGAFYTSLIGGLFFIFMPLEVMLARFMSEGNPFVLILLFYMAGALISYSLNYFIGLKLSRISKKLISPKKFYKVKGYVNRYGGVAIYVFNALPLPSQVLAAMLGVFRYNKTRFYFYFILGQLTKVIGVYLITFKF